MNRLKKFFIALLICTAPSLCAAYNQQFVGANTQTTNLQQRNYQPQTNTAPPSINIYVQPKVQQPTIQRKVPQTNVPQHSQRQPVQQSFNQFQQQAAKGLRTTKRAQTISRHATNTYQAPQAQPTMQPTPALAEPSREYTEKEQKIWEQNCLSAVRDKKVAAYANEFCNCGWRLISSGKVPPELLISSSPPLVKQRNKIMMGITQMCMAETLGAHKIK